MQLYYIRHAQSENNHIYDQTGGSEGRHPDPSLSALGVRQLPHLAALFGAGGDAPAPLFPARDPGNRQGFNLTHLYSSLFTRALLTATAIGEATGLPVHGWVDLHEHGGVWEMAADGEARTGLPGPGRGELARRFPHLVMPESVPESGWWNRPYEDEAAMFARAYRFLEALLARHGGTEDRVAVVSHAGFYHAVLRALLGLPSAYPGEGDGVPPVYFGLNNTGITRIDVHEGRRAIVYLNRLDHLPAELIT